MISKIKCFDLPRLSRCVAFRRTAKHVSTVLTVATGAANRSLQFPRDCSGPLLRTVKSTS
ncbi:hypothetical protein BDP27DRAFT_1333714 [Rhodocollybia butyracea]|uniref:Uncharacterized protein n=1 Tax=Rhodocollybia butyracea TaxID=206335 RepID=A0A9P5PJF5_9AGAR|nr:hypothetical protein BDP27DRAFT_1333714 [Rhodocollybia butyracea]